MARKIMSVCVAACMLLITQSAFAYQSGDRLVQNIRVDNNGQVMVIADSNLAGTVPTATGCSVPSDNYNKLAFSTSTAAGRAHLSVVLAAFLAGKTVYFRGNGTCSYYGGIMEDVGYFVIKP